MTSHAGHKLTIIYMHGGPTTGKTTIGTRLAARFRMPYFSKDGVKEPIFDHIGAPVAWETDEPLAGRKMDDAALAILLYLIEQLLAARQSCVIDSTFETRHVAALRELAKHYPYQPLQIHCWADAAVLAQRYRRRAESGERHVGHRDWELSENFDAAEMERRFQPLDIGGGVLPVDTTDLGDAELEKLCKTVAQLLR